MRADYFRVFFATLCIGGWSSEVLAANRAGDRLPFPPFDPTNYFSQIVWLAVFFTILYLLLSRVLLPRVANNLERRKDRIASDLDIAASQKRKAKLAEESFSAALKNAREEAHAIARREQEDAAADALRRREENVKIAGDRLRKTQKQIDEAVQSALVELPGRMPQVVEAVMESVVGRSVGKRELQKAIDNAVSGLKQRVTAPSDRDAEEVT